MSSKMGLAIVVGALLLGAPSALALAAGETNVDTREAVQGTVPLRLDGPGLDAPALDAAWTSRYTDALGVPAATHAVRGQVDALLRCQQAVRVPVLLLWGDITERREESLDLRLVRSVDVLTGTVEVPIVETVTKTLQEPSGLLGALRPVTKTVTEVTGVDVQETWEQLRIDVDVHVRFQAEYHTHGASHFPIQLALPVGAPFLGGGVGDLVAVCDGSRIHAALPEFPDRGDHDFWKVCIGCAWEDPSRYDGWYTRVLSAQARLAPAEEDAQPAVRHGLLFAASDVMAAAGAAADELVAGLDASQAQTWHDARHASAVSGTHAPAPASAAAPVAAGGAHLAALAGLLAAAAGLVAIGLLRRR